MGRALPVEAPESVLEQGSLGFLYRPRVEEQYPDELDDVQRLLIQLSPEGGPFERLIAVGRKRLPRSARRDRFWGFVDLILTPYDMNAALDAQVYGTKTKGLRHLPAARPFAAGTYELAWHGAHAHLRWTIDRFEDDPIAQELEPERNADYILTVANPDPVVWGFLQPPDLQSELFDDLELHVTIPTPFPPALQSRFRDRKYAQVDSPEWLDHPGAELVFVGTGE
ncbi:MAG TPA: hypothetical protein VEU30_16300 [Thermoanaerobaculia bacterium]|nr:hypothetical protein [Thermoanaerobaculia bacterium]